MGYRIVWVTLIGLLMAFVAVAADKSPEQPPIEKLVRDLGDSNYRIREAAMRSLRERGEEALPILRKTTASADPEIRRRLQLLTQGIERSVLYAPKLVTLKFTKRPVTEIVRELAKQSGYPVSVQENDPKAKQQITLNLERVPFWVAIDKICLDAGLVFQQNDGTESMILTQSEGYSPHISYSGPFRLTANSFSYQKNLNLGFVQRNTPETSGESLTLGFTLNVEAKLPLLSIGLPRVIAAYDELGGSMLVESEPNNGIHEANYPNDRGMRMYMQQSNLSLNWLNKDARKVKTIKASIPVVVLSEQRADIVIDNPLKVKNKKFTGTNLDIELLKVDEAQGPNKSVNVTGSFRNTARGANQNDYSWANSMHQRLELTDAQGNKYASYGPGNVNYHSATHFDATFTFGPLQGVPNAPKLDSPVKLVYYQWISQNHQVEFEFKDLPLP